MTPVATDLEGPHPVHEYIAFALQQNPEVQAARKRVEAFAYQVPVAASLPDPISFLHSPLEMPWFGGEQKGYRESVETASRIAVLEERLRAYQVADKILVDRAVLIPLNYARRNLLIKPWVTKFPAPVLGKWFLKDVIPTTEHR